MRHFLLVLVFGYSIFCVSAVHGQQKDTLLRFEAAPAAGYQYPFFLFIPAGCSPLYKATLLVEPNNTGTANDTFMVHEEAAHVQAATGPLGHFLSKELHLPLLVPVFPRPEKEWKIYTHLLDRDAMKVKKGPMKRLDLQLLAMINAARERLFNMGYVTDQQILMTGYSSSGVFCNRFAALHPVWVKGYAAGGINGMMMMPLRESNGAVLSFPLGIADFEKIKGEPFDIDAFRRVKQFLYMGALDTNDAVSFDDGYSKKERRTVYTAFGKNMMPDRWGRCQELYRAVGPDIIFKTYEGIGHGVNREVMGDLVEFFIRILK